MAGNVEIQDGETAFPKNLEKFWEKWIVPPEKVGK